MTRGPDIYPMAGNAEKRVSKIEPEISFQFQ